MPIPPPSGLTLEQYVACNRFGLKVFGEPLFEVAAPCATGKHGHGCAACSRALQERARKPTKIRQPWERRAA